MPHRMVNIRSTRRDQMMLNIGQTITIANTISISWLIQNSPNASFSLHPYTSYRNDNTPTQWRKPRPFSVPTPFWIDHTTHKYTIRVTAYIPITIMPSHDGIHQLTTIRHVSSRINHPDIGKSMNSRHSDTLTGPSQVTKARWVYYFCCLQIPTAAVGRPSHWNGITLCILPG